MQTEELQIGEVIVERAMERPASGPDLEAVGADAENETLSALVEKAEQTLSAPARRGLFSTTLQRSTRPMRWVLLGALAALVGAGMITGAVASISKGFSVGAMWGWTVLGLWAVAAAAAGTIIANELMLYLGLRRFERFRKLATKATDGASLDDGERERFHADAERLVSYLSEGAVEAEAAALHEIGIEAVAGAEPVALCGRLSAEVLHELDQQAYSVITREAFTVAALVSLSPFPVLDSLLVVLRGLGMIRKIAGVYRVRAGAAGSVRLLKRVFGTALYANLTQIAVSGLGGRLAGRIVEQVGLATAQGLTTGLLFIWIGLAVQREVRPVPFSDADHQAGMFRTLWRGLRRMLQRK
jgi:uncharacterized membrane protein YcjF (UPF0283 family)